MFSDSLACCSSTQLMMIVLFIFIIGFAPSIIQLNVTDIFNTSLTLLWELPYDIEPDMYNITYNYTELSGTSPRTGVLNLQIPELNVTDSMTEPVIYSYNLTDLLPYSVYDISVIAIYDHEESKPLTIQAQTAEGGMNHCYKC